MKLLYLIVFILFANCNLTTIEDVHGVSNLKLKVKNLNINKTNQKDVVEILGPPFVKDSFDKNIWSYFEVRKKTNFIGTKSIVSNDVIVLEFNNQGILTKFETFDVKSMRNLKFSDEITNTDAIKQGFIENLLASSKKRWELNREKFNKSQ